MQGLKPSLLVELSTEERNTLGSLARKRTAPHCEVQRAQALLMAADGMRNVEIADAVRVDSRTVSVWRKEFLERRLDCLRDRQRSGRRRSFSPSDKSLRDTSSLPEAGRGDQARIAPKP
jgi:hypothetical protein